MLIEIRCDQFRTKRIEFHNGLNIVLGDENATNSIGKSTLLMVIDFAFGGKALLDHNDDLARELGHHDYLFSFDFDGELCNFRRGTYNPDVIAKCDEEFQPISPMSLDEYTAFLKAAYGIVIQDISFRALVGLYLRVWGKDNLNVHKPLHIVQTQAARECVNNLIKTFGRYGEIKELTENLKVKEEQYTALRVAFKNQIIPKISKQEHVSNERKIVQIEREIADIKENLAKYATNIATVLNREMLDLKVEKDKLLAIKLTFESKLARVRRNLSDNRHIKSRHFSGLVQFFPTIDVGRLAKVEEFHSGVAKLLGTELRESEKTLRDEIGRIDIEIGAIDSKMAGTLKSVDEPTRVVDRVYELAASWHHTKDENTYFESEAELNNDKDSLKAALSEAKNSVIEFIESALNDGLRRIVNSVFGPSRKSPVIKLTENNYSFEVFEDTGTGTAYASLIVLDLTIFGTTMVPFIAHDSLLFKNIENDSVSDLLKVYDGIRKQSFVAIDESKKYGPKTAALLRARSVIQLDNDNVLYVKDWRKKAN